MRLISSVLVHCMHFVPQTTKYGDLTAIFRTLRFPSIFQNSARYAFPTCCVYVILMIFLPLTIIPSLPLRRMLQVEIYLDLSCTDSVAAWSTMAQVVEEFGDDVEFIYRLFPLPHDHIAFTIAQVSTKQFVL